jgi:hypothetical protein
MRTDFLTRPVPARPLINAIGSDLFICGLGIIIGMGMDASSPISPILIFGGGILSLWPVERDQQPTPWYAKSRRIGGIAYMTLGVFLALLPRILDWYFFRRFHEHLYDKSPRFGAELQWIAGGLILLGAYFVFVPSRPRTTKTGQS